MRSYWRFRQLGLGWRHWLSALLARFPPFLLLAVSEVFGTAEWLWRRRKAREVTRLLARLRQLARAPNERIACRHYFTSWWLTKFAHAYVALASGLHLKGLVDVRGFDPIEKHLAAGEGFLLTSLHSLHGHLAAAYAVRRGAKLLSLRKGERENLAETEVAPLVFYGATPIFVKPDAPFGAILKRALDGLRSGNAIFVYADGIYGTEKAKVELLGISVTLRPALLIVARLAQCPVYVVSVKRRGPKLLVSFSEPMSLRDESDMDTVFRHLADEYVTTVLQSPESLPAGIFERQFNRSKKM